MLKAFLASSLIAAAALSGAQSIPEEVKLRVIVDGETIKFEGQGPVVLNRRVYVPMRGVLEKLGASVDYDRDSRTITATGNNRTITLPIEGEQGTVDGRSFRLVERPIVMNDRLLVPLRLLSESLGAHVEWTASKMTVTITREESRLLEFVTSGDCARSLLPGPRRRR